MKNRIWSDYLWIVTLVYFTLSLFNIVLAWLGMICFLIPLAFALFRGNKAYCNHYCGRGQIFNILGRKLNLSMNRPSWRFLYAKGFRYGFLVFFMTMFLMMIYNTYLVFSEKAPLKETLTLLWTFRIPWSHAATRILPSWVVQFVFGFFSLMLTSMILGLFSMVFFKPRSWCAYCPMGTMTQLICQVKNHNDPLLQKLIKGKNIKTI